MEQENQTKKEYKEKAIPEPIFEPYQNPEIERKDIKGLSVWGSIMEDVEFNGVIADDGYLDIRPSKFGFGFAMDEDGDYIQFSFTADGTVVDIASSANATNADNDGDLCVFDGGTFIRIKNRKGSAKKILFKINHN